MGNAVRGEPGNGSLSRGWEALRVKALVRPPVSRPEARPQDWKGLRGEANNDAESGTQPRNAQWEWPIPSLRSQAAGHRDATDESRCPTPGSQTASSKHMAKEKTDQAGRRTLDRPSEAGRVGKGNLKQEPSRWGFGLGWGPV